MVTDAEGYITQNVSYIPYGEVFVEERNGVWNTPYLFNAKELDEETGMYYYGARYLNPKDTRWMSVDPLFENYDRLGACGPDDAVFNTATIGEDMKLSLRCFKEYCTGGIKNPYKNVASIGTGTAFGLIAAFKCLKKIDEKVAEGIYTRMSQASQSLLNSMWSVYK